MSHYFYKKTAKFQFNEKEEPYEVKLLPGKYVFECTGASGGGSKGGFGAHVSAVLRLLSTKTFYVYVGGKGKYGEKSEDITPGGFNGGGNGGGGSMVETGMCSSGSSGGGATDFRLKNGPWNSSESLESRIIVAGGGGGQSWDLAGGNAGRLVGYSSQGRDFPTGSCQSIAGGEQNGSTNFGYGDNGANGLTNSNTGAQGNGGGGGGWYGGKASQKTGAFSNAAGGGGSSYISGMAGCVDNQEITFKHAFMEDGNATKYKGNGFASITQIFPDYSRRYNQYRTNVFLFLSCIYYSK